MTTTVLAVPTTEADRRWQQWKARGEEKDRRGTTRMKAVAIVIGIGLLVAFLVAQFA
jgi:hypothetical protein